MEPDQCTMILKRLDRIAIALEAQVALQREALARARTEAESQQRMQERLAALAEMQQQHAVQARESIMGLFGGKSTQTETVPEAEDEEQRCVACGKPGYLLCPACDSVASGLLKSRKERPEP